MSTTAAGLLRLAALAACVLLVACGGVKDYHHEETFGSDARFRREFGAESLRVCAAARAVLLGQGYVVVSATSHDPELSFVGSKEFKKEEQQLAVLQIHVHCVDSGHGAMLFVTAVESHFDVKQSREQTTIGVPIVAPIYLSRSSSSETQIKTRGETVDDRTFYERFFNAVGRELRAP